MYEAPLEARVRSMELQIEALLYMINAMQKDQSAARYVQSVAGGYMSITPKGKAQPPKVGMGDRIIYRKNDQLTIGRVLQPEKLGAISIAGNRWVQETQVVVTLPQRVKRCESKVIELFKPA